METIIGIIAETIAGVFFSKENLDKSKVMRILAAVVYAGIFVFMVVLSCVSFAAKENTDGLILASVALFLLLLAIGIMLMGYKAHKKRNK